MKSPMTREKYRGRIAKFFDFIGLIASGKIKVVGMKGNKNELRLTSEGFLSIHARPRTPEREVKLNKFDQFKAEVDGVNIHFIHMKGKDTNSTPIILTHGFPDSFYRFYKVIPILTDTATNICCTCELLAVKIADY